MSMVYNNPFLNNFTPQPMYQQPTYQQPQQSFMPQQTIDWDAVARACQTLAAAASSVPGGGEYVTRADLEKLKKEILEGVKADAKPAV